MTTNTIDVPVRWGRLSVTALAIVLLGALAAPRAASAQVAAADIPQFVGTWNLPLEAQGQSFEMDLTIAEGEDGAATATIASDMGEEDIEEITLNGETLELTYTTMAQGMTFPVLILLTPEEEGLWAELDFADGQFFMETTATRAD